MAVVGQLLVELSANVARLRTDMERASGLVESHTKRMARAASVATGALGALGVGLSIGAISSQFMRAVESLDAFNDAADKTGVSVEELSALVNTLAPFGHGLDVISGASERLIKSMNGATDETKGAGAAFKALGIETRDAAGNLRSSPEVLDEVAQALAQYADGSNKTAIAVALFGKQGAELLPMLKDLAEAQKKAGTVTTEQADEAKKLAVALNDLRTVGVQLGQAIAGAILPKLNQLIEQFRFGQEAAGGFFSALARYGLATGSPEDNIARLTGRIEELNAAIAKDAALARGEGVAFGAGARKAAGERTVKMRAEIDQALKDLQYFRLLQAQAGRTTNLRAPGLYDAQGVRDQAPDVSGSNAAASAARDARDAYAALDELIRQADIDDELKQQAKAARELATQLERAAAAELSRIAAFERAEQGADDQIKRDIDAIKDAVDPTRALYRELERVRELTSAGLLPPEAGNARMMQIYSQIDGVLQTIPERAAEAQASMQQMLAPIESAFESAIMGGEKLSNVLASLAQDFARLMLRQQITGPLAALLSGGDVKSTGGTIVGAIAGGLGFRASGGPVSAGGSYIVGERGPELLQMGSASGYVVPNHRMASGSGPTIVQNITVGAGVNRAEVAAAMYAAKESAKAEILASMRRGSTFAAA